MNKLILICLVWMHYLTQSKSFVTQFHHFGFKRSNVIASQKLNNKFRIFTPFAGDNVDDSVLTSAFEKLKVVDLKEVVKKFGSKPKSMKKQELIDQCISLYRLNSTTTSVSTTPSILNDLTANDEQLVVDSSSISNSTVKKVRSLNRVQKESTNTTLSQQVNVHSTERECKSVFQNFPTGEERNSRLSNTSNSSDMELIFLVFKIFCDIYLFIVVPTLLITYTFLSHPFRRGQRPVRLAQVAACRQSRFVSIHTPPKAKSGFSIVENQLNFNFKRVLLVRRKLTRYLSLIHTEITCLGSGAPFVCWVKPV